MNYFVVNMLELGAKLDKAVTPSEISMVINDAEILYRNHIEQLTPGSENLNLTAQKIKREIKMKNVIETKRIRVQTWQHPLSTDYMVLKVEDFAPTDTENDWEYEGASVMIEKSKAIELRDALNELIPKLAKK